MDYQKIRNLKVPYFLGKDFLSPSTDKRWCFAIRDYINTRTNFLGEFHKKKLLAVVAVSAAALLSAQVQAKDIDLVSGAQALQDKIDAAAAKAENAKAEAQAKKAAKEAEKAEKAAKQKAEAEAKKAEIQKKIEEQKATVEKKKAESDAKAAAKKKAVEDAGKNLKNSLGNLQKAIAE